VVRPPATAALTKGTHGSSPLAAIPSYRPPPVKPVTAPPRPASAACICFSKASSLTFSRAAETIFCTSLSVMDPVSSTSISDSSGPFAACCRSSLRMDAALGRSRTAVSAPAPSVPLLAADRLTMRSPSVVTIVSSPFDVTRGVGVSSVAAVFLGA